MQTRTRSAQAPHGLPAPRPLCSALATPPATTSRPARCTRRCATPGRGKRLQPALVYALGEVFAAPAAALDAPACAVELMHAYSLVHDDLPAMDDDALRRRAPTCHRQFDAPAAILAGDGLQALAFEVIASGHGERRDRRGHGRPRRCSGDRPRPRGATQGDHAGATRGHAPAQDRGAAAGGRGARRARGTGGHGHDRAARGVWARHRPRLPDRRRRARRDGGHGDPGGRRRAPIERAAKRPTRASPGSTGLAAGRARRTRRPRPHPRDSARSSSRCVASRRSSWSDNGDQWRTVGGAPQETRTGEPGLTREMGFRARAARLHPRGTRRQRRATLDEA